MNLTASPNSTDTHTELFTSATADSGAAHDDNTLDINSQQTIDPNTLILAEALTDATIAWRIHNCKVSEKIVTQDKLLPFLYHYDSLDDTIKQTHPLTPELLAQFNRPMTASTAAKLIGIDAELIPCPWHVKIIGSLVVFSEALQLAVRLHWTNTGKDAQQIYTKIEADAIAAALKHWQFFGRIDVLYKNDKQPLISIDEQGVSDQPILKIDANANYQLLPASHALTIIAKIEADKEQLPWFETAILERIE